MEPVICFGLVPHVSDKCVCAYTHTQLEILGILTLFFSEKPRKLIERNVITLERFV